MIIGHRTIKVTDAEFDTLGVGLEEHATQEMKLYEEYEAFSLIQRETIDLLQSFVNLGYPIFYNNERYHDAWDWAEAKHKDIWQQKN